MYENIFSKYIQPNSVVFDLGANNGGITQCIFNTTINCEIYAFEPHPILYQALYNKFQDNHLVHTFNVAISSQDGISTLYFELNDKHNNYGASTIIKKLASKRRLSQNIGQCKVITSTIDSINIIPSFIKIDTEGSETNIIIGGKRILTLYKPPILMEYGKSHEEKYYPKSIEILKSYGYTKFYDVTHKCDFAFPDFCDVLTT